MKITSSTILADVNVSKVSANKCPNSVVISFDVDVTGCVGTDIHMNFAGFQELRAALNLLSETNFSLRDAAPVEFFVDNKKV